MAYLDAHNLAVDTDFRKRVALAAIDYCRTVVVEADTTANHDNRVALMRALLMDPDVWAARLAYGVAMLGGTGSSTDAQLKTFVGQLWDAYAGVAASSP
jgi:hypothetical protein